MRKSTVIAAALVLALAVQLPADAAAKGSFGKKGGYNGVRIHMTLKQAKATGKLKTTPFSGQCMHAAFKSKKYRSPVGVLFSRKYGLVAIGAPAKARTPRGIGVGSTIKQVKKAYPRLKIGFSFDQVPVPGHKTVRYGFQVVKGKVTVMWLMATKQDCAS
ncbi:hypothetical protein [Actinocorallia longicatena]|uniref:Uncharacterized protein n=1 Tax=Actinocorallia longicatena TaxID=111803 RepID=A0ABP6PZF0_9ACTN